MERRREGIVGGGGGGGRGGWRQGADPGQHIAVHRVIPTMCATCAPHKDDELHSAVRDEAISLSKYTNLLTP